MKNSAFLKALAFAVASLMLLLALASCKNAEGGEIIATSTGELSEYVERDFYYLIYENSENGRIEGELEQTVKEGESGKEVTAIPDEGYVFVGWSDGRLIATRHDSYVKSDIKVHPVFKPEGSTYTVRYRLEREGKVLQTVNKKAEVGKTITYAPPASSFAYELVWSDGKEGQERVDSALLDGYTVVGEYVPKSLGLPSISINTEDGEMITSKRDYKGCTVGVSNTDSAYCFEGVSAQIRGRGNSSWDHHDKKSFRIKFDEKRSMLGSDYSAKSWTLIANHADGTLSRNAMAYEFSSMLDDIAFTTMHEYVDVFLNGEYMGVYLLCDQIQTGEGRVDIEEELTGDPDTGYFILLDTRASWDGTKDLDYFTLSNDRPEKQYDMRTPDPDDPDYDPDVYLKYIQNYMNEALEALSSGDWDRICEYIDPESFADVYIVDELFMNIDCGQLSFYFYKPKGGKLFCGPVWDFDLSLGNSHYGAGNREYSEPDGDIQKSGTLWAAESNTWFRRLLRTEEFTAIVKEKLASYTDEIEKIIALADYDDPNSYYGLYGMSIERNYQRWDILGVPIWPNPASIVRLNTVEKQFDYIHEWLKERYRVVFEYYGIE